MFRVDLDDMIEYYLHYAERKNKQFDEKYEREVLKMFTGFLIKKNIFINELSILEEVDLIEYYLLLREKENDNERKIVKHLRIMIKFLSYIEKAGLNNKLRLAKQLESALVDAGMFYF